MITIGSRGSALALAQAGWVKEQILGRFPTCDVALKIIKTSADRDLSMPIRAGSAIGVFVKEIEAALIDGEIDLAVHSMKDVPTTLPNELAIGAVPVREDAHDALITRGPKSMDALPAGAIVGTGSVRRQSQIRIRRRDLSVVDIRGNVDTRLQKLAQGDYDAIILAAAGLKRLGLEKQITAMLAFKEMLPAPGQGALLLEIRRNDIQTKSFIEHLHDEPSAIAVLAERAFLKQIGGGCNVPVAVHARFEQNQVRIDGLIASLDGTRSIHKAVRQIPQRAQEAAIALAKEMLAAEGRDILETMR